MLMLILGKFSKWRKRTKEGWFYCTKETKSIFFLESYCIFLEVRGIWPPWWWHRAWEPTTRERETKPKSERFKVIFRDSIRSRSLRWHKYGHRMKVLLLYWGWPSQSIMEDEAITLKRNPSKEIVQSHKKEPLIRIVWNRTKKYPF